MQNNEQLQADIDTILKNSVNTPGTPQNSSSQQNLQNNPANFSQSQPTVAPQIQPASTPHITSPEIESQLNLSNNSENNAYNKVILFIPLIIVLIIIVITLIVKSIGPRSFDDCIADDTSKIYTLEPVYCQTKKGKIFYQDGIDRPRSEDLQGPVEEEIPIPPDII